MNKKRLSLLVAVLSFGFVFFFSGESAQALDTSGPHSYSVSQDGGYRSLCSGSGRVDFHPTVRNINLSANGTVSYVVRVNFARCDSRETRAYSIYGESVNCPYTGQYGGDGTGNNTYDCVKFLGDPRYQDPGTALSCDPSLTPRNGYCLYPRYSGDTQVFRTRTQPVGMPGGVADATPANTIQVPNWANERRTSGSATLSAGRVCQYFKYGSNWESESSGSQHRCATIRVTVRWTVEFNMVHQYSISDPTVMPGQQNVRWTWNVHNNGPDDAATVVRCQANWTVGRTGVARGPIQDANDWVGAGSNMFPTCTNDYDIPANALAGTQYCQNLQYRPDSSTDLGGHTTGNVCTTVQYNYSLRPTISVDPRPTGQPGSPATIMASIINTDANGDGQPNGSRSEPVNWRVHRLVYAPGSNHDARTDPPIMHSTSPACAYYNGESSCTEITARNGVVFNQGTTSITDPAFSTTVENLDAGSEVCYSLSVQEWQNYPGSTLGSDWRHSALACFTVAKTPKLQVRGGDVRVHGDGTAGTGTIITSTSRFNNRTYGSWTEYGAISNGLNTYFASGAGLLAGHTSTTSAPAPWSNLTFGNVRINGGTKSVELGGYALGLQSQTLRTFFNSLPATATSVSSLPTSTPGALHVYDVGAANVTLGGSANLAGSYIIRTTGTVTINGNITLNSGANLTGISQIPQVVIAADDIVIGENVSQVDAWLLAVNDASTCARSTAPVAGNGLTVNDCETPLTINGPVQARSIHFYRTAGGDPDEAAQPAETINFPGHSYLWFKQLQDQAGQATTTYTSEKPPRF